MREPAKTLEVKDYLVSGETFVLQFDTHKTLARTQLKEGLHLADYYPAEDYTSHQEKRLGIRGMLYGLVQRFMLHYKLSILKKHQAEKDLLDIGGGIGVFAQFLAKHGYDVALTEPNHNARKLAQKRGLSCFSSVDEIPINTSYSCLSLWHVLEHVNALDTSLQKYHNALKTNGLMLVAVPNLASFDAAYYGPYWAAYDVPRHLWHFTPQGLQERVETQGFRLLKTYPLWFDSFYISILSETYAKNKFAFLRGLFVGLYSNIRALFSQEYSSKIFVFQKLT